MAGAGCSQVAAELQTGRDLPFVKVGSCALPRILSPPLAASDAASFDAAALDAAAAFCDRKVVDGERREADKGVAAERMRAGR